MTLPRVALIIIGDGRTHLRAETVRSWHAQAQHYDLTRLVEVDDSMHLLGFCGAIRYAWDRLREPGPPFDYVQHCEEDWRFDRPFSIAHMARVLDTEPQVCQVALRRGAEPSENGVPIIERFPEQFSERTTGAQAWLEHRLFWTTNPSLYRADLIEHDWPPAPNCEARFTEAMFQAGFTFAYWGSRDDDAWITHTGTRTGRGY